MFGYDVKLILRNNRDEEEVLGTVSMEFATPLTSSTSEEIYAWGYGKRLVSLGKVEKLEAIAADPTEYPRASRTNAIIVSGLDWRDHKAKKEELESVIKLYTP